jgi:hypothetical protein
MPSKSSSRVLTDHDEIQRWAEERGATPARVRNTGDDEDPGIIRLDFPGYSGQNSLEEISWDEWFEKLEDNNLALIVQEETANGQRSNFNKLVSRDSVEESSPKKKPSTKKSSARGSSARKAPQRVASSRPSSGSSGRGSQKRAASSGSRTSHASGQTKESGRSNRTTGSPRQNKSSGRKAA